MSTPTPHHTYAVGWRHAWGEVWRIGLGVGVAVLLMVGYAATGTRGYTDESLWWIVELVAVPPGAALLLLRRRWPLTISVATSLLSAVAVSAIGPAAIALISLCTHRRARSIIPAVIVWLAAGVTFELAHPTPTYSTADIITNAVTAVLATAFCVAVGLAIGARRELVANLRHQVDTAAAQEKARVQQARLGERSRIAREMHDVLAHRISLVAMHSGALAYRTDLSPGEVREASGVIRDNAELALTELRQVLGVLRADERDGVEPPQPTLAALPHLIADTPPEEGGVDLTTEGDLDNVPDLPSRSAYRIIQEALTNRRKHAYGEPIVISIRHGSEGLAIRTSNSVSTGPATATASHPLPESGLGLLGLAERVELGGGRLNYGLDRAGRFTLTAALPLERA